MLTLPCSGPRQASRYSRADTRAPTLELGLGHLPASDALPSALLAALSTGELQILC